MRRASASTPTTGSMTRIRRSTCRASSCPRRSAIPTTSVDQWFSWFFDPRINIGAMINTGGKTSYGFTGLTWRIPIYKGFFFEGEFGGAVNTSPLRDEPGRVNTGCRFDFRESGGFGYQFNEHWDCHRQHRAHLAREPVHQHQPRLNPGRRPDRLQVLRDPRPARAFGQPYRSFHSRWREPWRMRSITIVSPRSASKLDICRAPRHARPSRILRAAGSEPDGRSIFGNGAATRRQSAARPVDCQSRCRAQFPRGRFRLARRTRMFARSPQSAIRRSLSSMRAKTSSAVKVRPVAQLSTIVRRISSTLSWRARAFWSRRMRSRT